jgi:hypothetical protein
MAGDLEVVSAQFYLEHNPQMQLPPSWLVQAKWHALDGRESECRLTFEPFHGYITGISLTPVVPKGPVRSSATSRSQKLDSILKVGPSPVGAEQKEVQHAEKPVTARSQLFSAPKLQF